MKIMSRDFTTSEKLLLLLLVLILLGLGYYYFIDQPVRSAIVSYNAEADSLQLELTTLEARIARLRQIQSSLDQLKKDDNLTWMGSYNNSEEEVRFLNEILADTSRYSISFENVSRVGDQIRRRFKLQYVTADYGAAQDIMYRLLQGKNRCLIDDVKCGIDANTGAVTMNQSATFYETMVGGTADAGLPAESAAANQ